MNSIEKHYWFINTQNRCDQHQYSHLVLIFIKRPIMFTIIQYLWTWPFKMQAS